MPDYVTFDQLLASLPRTEAAARGEAPFRVVREPGGFVEPVLTQYEAVDRPQVTFISARGATGKSAMAAEISRRLRAPLWSLGEDKAVSGDALAARLSAFLGVADPLSEASEGRVPLLVIDAMDEARLRVTGISWDEFTSSLADYARAGLQLAVLGRKRTIEDVWYSLAETVEAISWYEISHFNEQQQSAYVDLRALGESEQPSGAYAAAKSAVLAQLNGASDSTLDETFAGYAPVLDAVAALLKPGANYQVVINDFENVGVGGTRLRILRRILEALLEREQSKVKSLAHDLNLDAQGAYTAQEQLAWLSAELLGGPRPKLDWCEESRRDEYAERIVPFLLDHPFRDGMAWASPVFSSYVVSLTWDSTDREALLPIAGSSGLVYEFLAAGDDEPLVVDELQFAAIHASMMAGQWATSTSVVSVRSDESDGGLEPETAAAQLMLSQLEGPSTVLEATIVLDHPGQLQLSSPLASLDVEFSGTVVVTSRGASIDLGPDVFLRARSIELVGSSMQVSKDAGPGEATGPTVELEATETFTTQATLMGTVPITELSIVVPHDARLVFPWVRYRADPESDLGLGETEVRAQRFLNKLMNLARRHGHRGERAVFMKKLEGRQGLENAEFQRAITALVDLGVVRQVGDMLFLAASWDQHRYDGKGRAGMVSYEDKREIWEPVVSRLADAIR